MNYIGKLIFILTIAFFTSPKSHAQESQLANSLLWEISGNGLTQKSYLTGTMHIMCGKDFGILPKVAEAIKASDQLYLEINLNDPKEIAAMQDMILSETLLTETLSAEQQTQLDQALQDSMGMTIQQMNEYSMSTLLSLMLVKAVECADMKVLDMELSVLAASEGKIISALETVQEQSEFMDKAFSDELILSYFQYYDEYKSLFADMVEKFKAEDLLGLRNIMQDPKFSNKDIEYWLLKVRNENWVNNMPEIMQQSSTVFAVGAAHLPGDFGVINLLQEAGFSVKPVMN